MHRMGAADGRRRRLAEAEEARLPLLDQLRHRADRLLDRNLGVDPVLVTKIDRLDLEPPEARFAGRAYIVRSPAHAAEAAVLASDVAELCGEEHLVATPG